MPNSSFRKDINSTLIEIVQNKLQLIVLLGAVQEDNSDVERLKKCIDRGINELATLPEIPHSSLEVYNPNIHKELLAQYTAEMRAWVEKSRRAFIKHFDDLSALKSSLRPHEPQPSDFAAQSKLLISQLQLAQMRIHRRWLEQNSPKFEPFLNANNQEKTAELLAMAAKLREPDHEQEELERLEQAIKASHARATMGLARYWPPIEKLFSEIDETVRIVMEGEDIGGVAKSYRVEIADIVQSRSETLEGEIAESTRDARRFLEILYTAAATASNNEVR